MCYSCSDRWTTWQYVRQIGKAVAKSVRVLYLEMVACVDLHKRLPSTRASQTQPTCVINLSATIVYRNLALFYVLFKYTDQATFVVV
jgi:hypothetical protein